MSEDLHTTEKEEKGKKKNQGKRSSKHYTAVVYVHGMGSQRRNEEVSNLIDQLDKFSHRVSDLDMLGKLSDIQAHLEGSRVDEEKNISFISTTHRKRTGDETQIVRFYEAYWAPIMAGGSSVPEVLKWIFLQVLAPIKTIRQPWRSQARLRRTALISLWHNMSDKRKAKYGYKKEHLERVLKLYDDFEGLDARRQFKKGSHKDFRSYIGQQQQVLQQELEEKRKSNLTKKQQKETRKKLQETQEENILTLLVRQWKRHYLIGEVFNEFVLLTLFVALALGAAAFFGAAVMLLNALVAIDTSNLPFQLDLEVSYKNVLTVVGIFVGSIGITSFLKNYLGDVQMWATYTETDEKYLRRKKVVKEASDIFHHVLLDHDHCDRVIVVAHSLGTSVAHDALLEIGRYNRARNIGGAPIISPLPLIRIEHFISLATPVDKIYYFFENYKSKSHRYNRVVEQIRGDISEVPFAKNSKRQIHWINFWDAADIISGSIESPHNANHIDLRVDNYQVYNRWFPDPNKSHFAYFDDVRVLRILFDSIFNRKYNFVDYKTIPKKSDGESPDYKSLVVGPGKGIIINRIFQAFMLLLPWFIGGAILGHLFQGGSSFTNTLTIIAIIITFVLVIGWIVSWIRGHLVSYDTLPKQ